MIEKCKDFMDDLQTKNVEKIATWFDDNSILNIPPAGDIVGARRIAILFKTIFKKYEDLNWCIKEIVPINDTRGIFFTRSWGQKNGCAYTNEILTEIVFNENGKIKLLSDYFKISPAI